MGRRFVNEFAHGLTRKEQDKDGNGIEQVIPFFDADR
jgi:hypothetical protein